jgi:gliding motility-associated-like protein
LLYIWLTKFIFFYYMHKQKIRIVILLFVISFFTSLRSQITFTPTSGCAPLQVSFSAPAGTASWNFGNGTSNLASGANLYSTPGTYNVTYSGVGGSFTQLVTVYANNVVAGFSFNTPSSKCAPMSVSFNGTGGSSGSLYQWAFADGGQAMGSSVNHSYSLGGVYNVTLTVKDFISGCVDVVSNGPINVSTPPNIVINSNPGLTSCTAPFTTAFTASNSTSGSPLGGSLTFNWNFGNSQTSTQATPGNITFNQGVYTVTLIATDNNNCTNSLTTQVSAIQPTVNAVFPASVCVNGQQQSSLQTFSFTVQSSQPTTTINMGDGNTIVVPPPPLSLSTPTTVFTYTYPLYSLPGIKTITITASTGNCVATQTQSIFVEKIVPQFTTSAPFFTCSPILIKPYTNQSTVNSPGPLSYTWTVRAWNNLYISAYITNSVNPTFTFTQGSNQPYTFFGMYKPEVLLVVTSALGCKTYVTHIFDSIHRPTAWFNKNKKEGCVPLTVKFRDSSDTSPIYPIQSYTWNNGANPPTLVSGTIPPPFVNPTFAYSVAGTYTPYLTISTAGGCTDVSFIDTIYVVNTPTVNMALLSNAIVCAGQTVQINLSASPTSTAIQHWHVETDKGFFSGCVSNTSPIWPFTHLGVHGFTVSAYEHGCESSSVSSQTITVKGPLAKFRYRTNCANKKSVDFFSHLQQVQTASLDFGDSSTPLTIVGNATGTVTNATTHVYANTGDYVATLTATNSLNGCAPYTQTMLVTVREINADFQMAPVICKGGVQTFSAGTSTDVEISCARGYAWFIDNFPAVQTSSSFYSANTATSVGTHTVTLWVKDKNSCTDTMTRLFRVASPIPTFTFNANPICLSNNPKQIINTTAQSPDAVNNFTLFYGVSSTSLIINSVTVSPTYNYLAAPPSQTYAVKLIAATDLLGCKDSIIHVLKVNNPNAYLIPSVTRTCVGAPIVFNASGGYTSTINFGDAPSFINFTGASSYNHSYSAAGNYTSSINIVDDGNCTSTYTAAIDIQSYPTANFSVFESINPANTGPVFCAPIAITFSSTTNSNAPIGLYDWNLGTGSPITNEPEVGTIFSIPGIKTITLSAYTTNGCKSTITKTLSILSPTANLVINKTRFCLGEEIKVSLKDTSGIEGWIWFFGDGAQQPTITAASAPTPTLSYPYVNFPQPFGSASIQLYYFASGKNCPNYSEVGISIVKIDPDFKRNNELLPEDVEHCISLPDQFTNKSKLNNNTSLNGLTFNWDFGNGATSSVPSPTYTYPSAGVYSVSLTASDVISGCPITIVKNMTIHPLPTVTVSVVDTVCRGSSFILNSSGTTDIGNYEWFPKNGLENPLMASTTATALTSTSYSLAVTSIFGCKNTSNIQYVYVQQPPPIINWDTTVVVGQLVTLNTYVGQNYTYTWSPIVDLNCGQCAYPVSTTTANITYSVEVEDPLGCFKVVSTYSVYIDPLTSVDVPTAFTPNGDGVNDVIYVDGWGIKKLNYFRIFNRWGQVLFESNDIKLGWNGIYNGVPQNMETYVYQVSVETYVNSTSLEKTGTFKLIR